MQVERGLNGFGLEERKGEIIGLLPWALVWASKWRWKVGQVEGNGLGSKEMGLGSAKGRNEHWSLAVLLLHILQCFGSHFFHKYLIDTRSISIKK